MLVQWSKPCSLSLRSVRGKKGQVCYPNFSRMQIRRALWLAMNHLPKPGLTGPEYAALCVARAPCMKPSVEELLHVCGNL